ncbi:DUF1330 domain-containing protein [Marinibaculum pumilum]|uniref:DUF1330 domain-containing protein n=1 Tax=Marinibaculum pumilum TaxID=1766165 RepID=A0ABV7L9Y5_9PROT
MASAAEQGPPAPAYLVLAFRIVDPEPFLDYARRIPALIARHRGRYIVKGAHPTAIEGGWAPDRLVILEFESRANAGAFLEDAEARDLFALRHRGTDGNLILVDGCR